MTLRSIGIACVAFVCSCSPSPPPPPVQVQLPRASAAPIASEVRAAPQPALPPARAVMAALKKRDMKALARLAHPRGIRFSPYAFVDEHSDVTLRPDELAAAWLSSQPRRWGTFDGSGEPIELTFRHYFDRFVYDVDFATAPRTSINEALGSGNTTNNAAQVYPEGVIVEHHFPGFEPQYQGMDWRSLRLVFAREGASWWLVAIIHDGWTI